jgi:hypothetical protein
MNLRKLELEDQSWFPKVVKDGMTDYLKFLFQTFNLYHPVVPLLWDALQKCSSTRVIDLCSGSGGAIEKISRTFQKKYDKKIEFVLTDFVPRVKTWRYLSGQNASVILYEPASVDAMHVPVHLKGFRTIFSGIHHFEREGVKSVVRNTARAGEGIAIFDGGDKNIWMVMLIVFFHPIAIILLTPFIKPFCWSRLFFTYLFPLILIGAVWDGVISIINLYKSDELLNLAKNVDAGYEWKSGKVRNKFGLSITYLIGLP